MGVNKIILSICLSVNVSVINGRNVRTVSIIPVVFSLVWGCVMTTWECVHTMGWRKNNLSCLWNIIGCRYLKQPRVCTYTCTIFWGGGVSENEVRNGKETWKEGIRVEYKRQRHKYTAIFSDLTLAPLLCLRGSPWLCLFTEISSTRLSLSTHTHTQYALIHQRANTEPGRRPELVLHAITTHTL